MERRGRRYDILTVGQSLGGGARPKEHSVSEHTYGNKHHNQRHKLAWPSDSQWRLLHTHTVTSQFFLWQLYCAMQSTEK